MAMLYAVGRGVSSTRSVPVRTSFIVETIETVHSVSFSRSCYGVQKARTKLALVRSRRDIALLHARIDVSGQMIQDFQGEMPNGLLGPLDQLARVGLGP